MIVPVVGSSPDVPDRPGVSSSPRCCIVVTTKWHYHPTLPILTQNGLEMEGVIGDHGISLRQSWEALRKFDDITCFIMEQGRGSHKVRCYFRLKGAQGLAARKTTARPYGSPSAPVLHKPGV